MTKHEMFDKFFDLKADALEEKRGRKRMGYNAHCWKLKHNRGYIVRNLPIQIQRREDKK